MQVTGPLAGTTEYEEPPGPVPPADASKEDLAALQAQTWSSASLSVAGIRVQGFRGKVPGYSSCSFKVEFTPRIAGKIMRNAVSTRRIVHMALGAPADNFEWKSSRPKGDDVLCCMQDGDVLPVLLPQVLWRFLCWCRSLRLTTRPWLYLP